MAAATAAARRSPRPHCPRGGVPRPALMLCGSGGRSAPSARLLRACTSCLRGCRPSWPARVTWRCAGGVCARTHASVSGPRVAGCHGCCPVLQPRAVTCSQISVRRWGLLPHHPVGSLAGFGRWLSCCFCPSPPPPCVPSALGNDGKVQGIVHMTQHVTRVCLDYNTS